VPALFNLLIHGFLVFVLLPIVLVSLATGSKQPEGSLLAKYYRAEPWLGLAGNIFLLALCALAATKLALLFGFIDATLAETIDNAINFPFLGMLLVMSVLWIRAVLKVRRESRNPA
jgi:hypothetical protein